MALIRFTGFLMEFHAECVDGEAEGLNGYFVPWWLVADKLLLVNVSFLIMLVKIPERITAS